MKLFRKREGYTILTDNVSNFKVQKIVDEVCVKGEAAIITAIEGKQFLITFDTKLKREELFDHFDKAFRLIADIHAEKNLVIILAKRDCAY